MRRTARDGQIVAEASVLRDGQPEQLGAATQAKPPQLTVRPPSFPLNCTLPSSFLPSSPWTCLNRQGSKIRAQACWACQVAQAQARLAVGGPSPPGRRGKGQNQGPTKARETAVPCWDYPMLQHCRLSYTWHMEIDHEILHQRLNRRHPPSIIVSPLFLSTRLDSI